MVIDQKDSSCLTLLLEVLQNNGLAIIPGDTIYGIVGVAPQTEEKIKTIKGRKPDKPFIKLLADKKQLIDFCLIPPPKEVLALIPGPLTLIVWSKTGNQEAVRVPSDPFSRSLLKKLKKPLFSTSVNKSGTPALNSLEKIKKDFIGQVDIIVSGDNHRPPIASTLLDISAKPFRLIRKGACQVPDNLLRQ